jgi:carboxypeptidase family protein
MNRLHHSLVGVLLLSAAFSSSAAAQAVVRGQVVDQPSGAPMQGVFVMLLNPEGRRVAGVLSDEKGEFVFRAAPGHYSIRADRIGYKSGTIAEFALTAQAPRTFRIALETMALRLPEITVRSESRCVGRPEGGTHTAQLWNEARKALTVAAWLSNSAATFRYRMVTRVLNASLEEVGRPTFRFLSGAGRRVFVSMHPDSLLQYGYVQTRLGETTLYGPDAELLLSDSFLDQHCFRVERRAGRAGLIGLGFEPISGRRLPDIRGVLWLDERTAELRFIEFNYTGKPEWNDYRFAGGRTEFKQLPNGAWIVSRYYIRSPSLTQVMGQGYHMIGAREEGGEVLDVQAAGPRSIALVLVPRRFIEGVVFDSMRGRPLDGAQVYLSGTSFTTVTRAGGRFRLDSIPVGEYDISFAHDSLGLLPTIPAPIRLHVDSMGAAPNIRLFVPSAERVIDEVCSVGQNVRATVHDSVPRNRGVLFGSVRETGVLRDNMTIQATWETVYSVTGAPAPVNQLRVQPYTATTPIDADGEYTLCGLPIDHRIQIDLNANKRQLRRDTLRILPPGLMRRDYTLPGR